MKKDYYPLEEVVKGRPYTVNDLLHFGETGRLKMCVVLPPTIVEITRLTPINELDENSKWAKLINEPHEDSEQAKGEDPPEFIHETIKMDEIAGPYHLFAGDVMSIRKEEKKEKEEKEKKEEGIESVHDGNFDTNRMFYRFLDDNGRRTKKKFDITDLVITHEEKIRLEKECGSDKPEDENITKISFYKNGQIWKIGTPGKEKDLSHLKGYELIQFLLSREMESLDAAVVYNLGKCSTNSPNDEKVSKGVTDSMLGETKQPMIDEKARVAYKEKLENLKEKIKIKTTTDPEKALEYKEEIEKLEKYLADASYYKTKISDFRLKNKENCRTNVQKLIGRALEAIHESDPRLKEFLNNETIHTGGECWYKSDPLHPVQWILSPPV